MNKKSILLQKIFNRIIFVLNKIINSLEELRHKERQILIPNNSLIFDIGFNIGNFSKSILKKNNTCNILAVEANPDLIDRSYKHPSIKKLNLICANVDNQFKTIHINKKYLGISSVSEEFLQKSRFVKGSKNQPTLIKKNGLLFDKKLKIKTVTLDVLIETHGNPFLIKIDVEGYEFEVLKGLTKKVNKITFEWSEEFFSQLEKTIEHLKSIGFKKFGVVGYFIESKNLNDKILHSNKGDPFLIEPNYYSWEEIYLKNYIDENRRINYGMIWAT